MKLIKLSCSSSTFKEIDFNPEGITFIIGDSGKAENKSDEGSSNGVGKTLALAIVHHCLGAQVDKKLKSAVPDWLFRLDFELSGSGQHYVERSGDGKLVYLDGRALQVSELRSFLNESGGFYYGTAPFLSFRSLIKRFARLLDRDCYDPCSTHREQAYDALLRTLYLLGADYSLVLNKIKLKETLTEILNLKKGLKSEYFLDEIFRTGEKPKIRYEWLLEEIQRLTSDLEKYQVAENYSHLNHEVKLIAKKRRKIEREKNVLEFQLQGIEELIAEKSDISRNDLMALYEGLEKTFRPEVLRHFEAVEQFHEGLQINRHKRLSKDKLDILKSIKELEQEYASLGLDQDEKNKFLRGKFSQDEYLSIEKKKLSYEEESERLSKYLEFEGKLAQKEQDCKSDFVSQDAEAMAYVLTQPLQDHSTHFKKLANQLYPKLAAGIDLESNNKDNKLRYNLTVHISGQSSDGINAARIICFDWLTLMCRERHTIDFLWHDNRLFAHLDPDVRSEWMKYIDKESRKQGKQYIATLNTENFSSMRDNLNEEYFNYLESKVAVTLTGDKEENKLLGKQFG